MTEDAREAARAGRCDLTAKLGKLVLALDARYYGQVFAPDPAIRGCIQVAIPQSDRPPVANVAGHRDAAIGRHHR